MGMFDSIRASLDCPDCGSSAEREIQTKQGALREALDQLGISRLRFRDRPERKKSGFSFWIRIKRTIKLEEPS